MPFAFGHCTIALGNTFQAHLDPIPAQGRTCLDSCSRSRPAPPVSRYPSYATSTCRSLLSLLLAAQTLCTFWLTVLNGAAEGFSLLSREVHPRAFLLVRPRTRLSSSPCTTCLRLHLPAPSFPAHSQATSTRPSLVAANRAAASAALAPTLRHDIGAARCVERRDLGSRRGRNRAFVENTNENAQNTSSANWRLGALGRVAGCPRQYAMCFPSLTCRLARPGGRRGQS